MAPLFLFEWNKGATNLKPVCLNAVCNLKNMSTFKMALKNCKLR